MKEKKIRVKDKIEVEFVDSTISLFPFQISVIIFLGSRAKGVSEDGIHPNTLYGIGSKNR